MSYDNLFNGSVRIPNQTQWNIDVEKLYSDRDIWTPHVAKAFPLGAKATSRDGRIWRYCKNGAGALTLANINQQALGIANWEDEPQTVASGAVIAAVGDKSITLLVQTAPTNDEWVDGYMVIENGTGEGNMYVIKDHTLTTNPLVQIADAGGFRVATVDGTDITIVRNLYNKTIVFPTDPTGVCTGVNHTAVTANYFYWAQVHGPCPVFNGSDTIIVGDEVVAGAQAAGVLALPDAGSNNEGDTVVGTVMRAPATGEVALVFLTIE